MKTEEIQSSMLGLLDSFGKVTDTIINAKRDIDKMYDEIRERKHRIYLEVLEAKDENDKALYKNETLRENEVQSKLKNDELVMLRKQKEVDLMTAEYKYKVISKKIEVYKSILAYKTAEIAVKGDSNAR